MPSRLFRPLSIAFAAAVLLISALGAAAATSTVPRAAAAAQAVQVTFIKVICPTYTVVPANQNPTNKDATGGHGGQLDASYGTTLVNPATDIPKSCTRADGWQFVMFNSNSLTTTVGSPVTTGADGSGTGATTIFLDPTELALAQTAGSPTGLWVAEVQQPGVATFGAIRCYEDILNGDNRENIRGVGVASLHVYCIAYNVAVAQQPTPTPPTASPSGGSFGTNPSQTPFESFAGATGTPGATPPPTDTAGTTSGGDPLPVLPLLTALAFGLLGLAASDIHRRRARR
jgi:hypothetical protein